MMPYLLTLFDLRCQDACTHTHAHEHGHAPLARPHGKLARKHIRDSEMSPSQSLYKRKLDGVENSNVISFTVPKNQRPPKYFTGEMQCNNKFYVLFQKIRRRFEMVQFYPCISNTHHMTKRADNLNLDIHHGKKVVAPRKWLAWFRATRLFFVLVYVRYAAAHIHRLDRQLGRYA